MNISSIAKGLLTGRIIVKHGKLYKPVSQRRCSCGECYYLKNYSCTYKKQCDGRNGFVLKEIKKET
jgi:hypothetical protein